MTDQEAVAKGHRAALCEEFLRPILDETRQGYLDRIAEIAATELNPKSRTEKITALSIALRIHRNIDNGLKEAIETGKIAKGRIERNHEIEKLGKDSRRLLDIVPLR